MNLSFRHFILCLFFSISLSSEARNKPPASALYPIVWKWLGGNSDSVHFFKHTDYPALVNNLKNAYQVRRAREFWYNKNMGVFESGSRNWMPVTNFSGRFQTIRGVFRAGFDMVEQTLGGFTVNIYPSGKDSIEFELIDLKSRWSLFLHLPFIKNIPYQSGIQVQRNMTNSFWVFTWKESIENLYFHKRYYNVQFKPRRKFSGHHF